MDGEEKFLLIVFIDDPGAKMAIDIVPSNWISFDEECDYLVTKFVPKSTAKNIKILDSLVKSRSEPPVSWPQFRIDIRGYAKTYTDAKKKLKTLETEPYACSTDNEQHAEEKNQAMAQKFMKKGTKKANATNADHMLNAVAFDLTNSSNLSKAAQNTHGSKVSGKSKSTRRDSSVNSEHQKNKNTDAENQKAKRRTIDYRSVRKLSSSSSDSQDNTITSDVHADVLALVEERRSLKFQKTGPTKDLTDEESDDIDMNSGPRDDDSLTSESVNSEADKANGNSRAAPERSDSYGSGRVHGLAASNSKFSTFAQIHSTGRPTPSQESAGKVMAARSMSEQNDCSSPRTSRKETIHIDRNDDIKTIVMNCHRDLSIQLSQIRSQIMDIKLRQTEHNSINVGGRAPKDDSESIEMCMDKYELGQLPFKSLNEFEIFDEQLRSNKSFRTVLVNALSFLINPDPKLLGKSVRDMIQKFMTRDLVLQFTAVKQSGKKKIMKTETAFYTCLRDALMREFGHSASLKEKNITDAIGTVINGATDWNGHRLGRKKIILDNNV